MPPPSSLSLFFDCISPYTHISLSLWSRYLKVWPVEPEAKVMAAAVTASALATIGRIGQLSAPEPLRVEPHLSR